MPLASLRGSTPLPSPLVPQAYASYDPVTRRKVRFIETIVPSLQTAEGDGGESYPADRFYTILGLASTSANIPPWVGSPSGTFAQWASPNMYLKLTGGISGTRPRFIHYLGVGGEAPMHAPKNADVTKVFIEFRARFPQNADYDVRGVGASSSSVFSSSSDHFIQVTRNSGNWDLGTCDGSTISQTASSGGADGSFHDFRIEWNSAEVELSVDGTVVVTKTTNRPAQALQVAAVGQTTTSEVDMVDYLVRWE